MEAIRNIVDNPEEFKPGSSGIAVVTEFMKSLDPGSVVKESEFQTAANSGGGAQNAINTLTKFKNGQNVSAEQMQDFAKVMQAYYDARKNTFNKRYESNLARYAKTAGMKPDDFKQYASENFFADKPAEPAQPAQ